MNEDSKLNQEKRATIEDVAAHAGVAVGTVSRYLNGAKLRKSNQDKIAAAIDELEFRRNAGASRIQRKHTQIVGMLVTSVDQFYADLTSKVSDHLLGHGFLLIPISNGLQSAKLSSAMKYFVDQGIDALILSGDTDVYENSEDVRKSGLPVVVFNNDIRELNTDRVLVNNSEAIFKATNYLIDLGHEKIGFLCGGLADTSAGERRDGYIEALKSRNIEPDENLIAGYGWTEQSGFLGAQELFSNADKPSALIGSSYLLTRGAMKWFKNAGLRYPDDVSIISFDDVDLFQHVEPGITAIAQPIDEIANYIVSFVVSRVMDEPKIEMRSIKLECEMIHRGSVAKRQ